MTNPVALSIEQRIIFDLLEALREIEEIADDRADVNWEGNAPNDWMRVLTLCRDATSKIRGTDYAGD